MCTWEMCEKIVIAYLVSEQSLQEDDVLLLFSLGLSSVFTNFVPIFNKVSHNIHRVGYGIHVTRGLRQAGGRTASVDGS